MDCLEGEENQGTLVLDATCVPVDIRYPQDVSLLNEVREKLETIIYVPARLMDWTCQDVISVRPGRIT